MTPEEQLAARIAQRRADIKSVGDRIAQRRRELTATPKGGGNLQVTGPGPGGVIPRELYDIGAIARRPQEGVMATPAGNSGADVAASFGSGLVSGAAGLADLPGQVSGMIATGAEKAGVLSPELAEAYRRVLMRTPFGPKYGKLADRLMPGAREYEPQTTAGKYAKTVGEFLPASATGGAGAIIPAGIMAGLASEAAGQLTEGTTLEPYARVAGAVAAPASIGIGTKAFQSAFGASQAKPSLQTLEGAKRAAYKAVDDAGDTFTGQETQTLFTTVKTALDDGNYVQGVDKQTDAALTLLERKAGQELKLGQLDKIRQSLWKRYTAAPNETGILDAIDSIDGLLASRASTNELLAAARLANSRFKKAQLLDDAFTKAADQTASTGSGGNILNKYRQAVTNIINNPRHAKWFSDAEISAMRDFIRGSFSENALRRFGKLSPGGNGLMLALNLGAVTVEPTMLAVTAAASGAKAAADRMATRGAEKVLETVAGHTSRRSGEALRNVGPAALGAAVSR